MLLPPLYPILDADFLSGKGTDRRLRMQRLVEELLAAGVTLVQYRNKSGREAEVLADAVALREAAPTEKCLLIMNDYPVLAKRAGLDGAHVGQQDPAPEEARKILGSKGIVGMSTHNPEQLALAERTSADYLAIGPVFATTSKQNPDPVIGLAGVRLARELTKKPLVAIGGITLDNCRAVIEAGADSVAVISALFADPSGAPAGKIASDFFARLR